MANKGILDFSELDCFTIKLRGNRLAEFKITPQGNEVLDLNSLSVIIGFDVNVSKTLTVGSGILNNGDGSFTVQITPSDFNYKAKAQLVIFGILDNPNLEIATANIQYTKGLW
jgi:hypothetical protein